MKNDSCQDVKICIERCRLDGEYPRRRLSKEVGKEEEEEEEEEGEGEVHWVIICHEAIKCVIQQ